MERDEDFDKVPEHIVVCVAWIQRDGQEREMNFIISDVDNYGEEYVRLLNEVAAIVVDRRLGLSGLKGRIDLDSLEAQN